MSVSTRGISSASIASYGNSVASSLECWQHCRVSRREGRKAAYDGIEAGPRQAHRRICGAHSTLRPACPSRSHRHGAGHSHSAWLRSCGRLFHRGARAGGVDQSVVHHAVGRYADLRDDHIRGIGDYGSQSREITAIVTLATTPNAGAPVGRSAHAPSPAHAADRWGTAR